MASLSNKVAFITGGASGIGKGTAIRFAQEGASIAIADMSEEDGRQVVGEIERNGGRATFFKCDVSKDADVRAAIDGTVKSFGGLNIVFANAGINGVWTPIEELQPDEWDRTLNINLRGTYLTVHYAIPHLRKAGGGSVLITSSVNGNRTFATAGASAYSTSKAGQVAFMKMAALELARYNIRVNAICPGAIKTNIGQRTEQRHTEEVEVKVELPKGKPGIDGGVGDIFEVADACLFLASDQSRHVSGVELYVDGGASLLK
ncbi:MAG TPA: SDR family NAD(P)-dependent oxidoreductase [Tepidisphaeraceae bacterium]|jgi:NAD(P)-dependent dehydrogenase (short-subunit alcohol dehydrogenase family)|nr:SDR family NAD(P)-dependent oxidoreductase [Tepidisphaeraceae bacterium]